MNDAFRKFSGKISNVVGSPGAFILAVVVIIAWAVSGPIFGFSDTWQLEKGDGNFKETST